MTNPLSTTSNYIGLDISGTMLRSALLNSEGAVLERRSADLSSDEMIDQITATVGELRGLGAAVEAVGIGIPGLIDRQTDDVLISKELPGLVHSGLQATIQQSTGLRVELENDANAAAYGEYLVGAGRGSHNVFYVTLGTGVGGAIILDDELWVGASGFAGEFGHISVIDTAGEMTYLETVASAPNIVRRSRERLLRDSTSSLSKLAANGDFTVADLVREARNGDDFSALMIERTGRYIGTAIASVINLLNLERIILGGLVMEAGDLIMDPILREAERRSFAPCFAVTQIVAGALGLDAVMIGAALLARDAKKAIAA
jgi:glucokinase